MFVSTHTNQSSYPHAEITINKNRLKKQGSTIFMKDGTEYEIELDNNTNRTFMAKIKLDGEYISDSGIVLYPGQRVYLERFLDTNRRFRFHTYEIEESRLQGAARNNGFVEIEFYREQERPKTHDWNLGWNNKYFRSRATDNNWLSDDDWSAGPFASAGKFLGVETGKTGEGSVSSQEFRQAHEKFENFVCRHFSYQLLPLSRKPIEVSEITQYCSECGYRRRRGHNFCPKCGDRF